MEVIQFFAATDVGVVRDHNEDNFLVDKKLGLYVVADGMGGHAAGEVASAIAVRALYDEIKRESGMLADFLSGVKGASRVTARDIALVLEHGVHAACSRIYEAAQKDPEKRGMGTTLSALLVVGTHGFVAHVGDSRVYLARERVVSQLTIDHTVENEVIKKQKLTPEQLKKLEPKKNALMRAVGVYERVDVDSLSVELLPGDRLFLASDGLTQYLQTADELLVPAQQGASGDEAVKALISLAKERGGSDNITVILVQVLGDANEAIARAKRVAQKRETLRKVPIFARLDEREMLRLLQVVDTREFKKGDELVKEGAKGSELFVILSGTAQVSRGGQTLTNLGPGQHFGEMALIRATPRSATVSAESAGEVLLIHRNDFYDILREEHQIGVKVLWEFLGVLAERLDKTSGELHSARKELEAEIIETAPDTIEYASPFSMRGNST
jgi:PPM family protein phosphatase